jgi:hypothetical protein
MDTAPKTPRITRGQARTLLRFLWMEYKPSEIANELGIKVDTIYKSYIPNGMPYRIDKNGNYWIVGTDFKEWAMAILTQTIYKPKTPMQENQAFCVTCKRAVFFDPTKKESMGKGRSLVHGRCPDCGGKTTRFSKDQPDK